MLRGRRDDGVWLDADRVMALALTAYEESLCSGCGMPAHLVRGDENVGRHTVEETICHGCEDLESARQDSSRQPYPGQKLYLVEA